MLENILYQSLSACVLPLQSFFLLCISVGVCFCWKTGFWFLTGCICLISSYPTLTSREGICVWQSDSRAWLWMLLEAEIFIKCFSMKSEKRRSKLHFYFKGKGYSRIHSIEKKMSPRSQQVSTNSILHSFHTSSVTLINHFIWGFLVQLICIPYSMRRI